MYILCIANVYLTQGLRYFESITSEQMSSNLNKIHQGLMNLAHNNKTKGIRKSEYTIKAAVAN